MQSTFQAQKEDLDRALRMAAEKGVPDKEYATMKEELSALPRLKEELEALKARVSELTQLTGTQDHNCSHVHLFFLVFILSNLRVIKFIN